MNPPSCPLCGRNDTITRVASPHGQWFCGCCSTVFDGGDAEWAHWARKRRERIERETGGHRPLPVQQSWRRPRLRLVRSDNGDKE